jgi:hypothetical protein
MNYEYKCVSGPTIVAVKSAKARDQAVKAFEDIMNAQARDGWEYVGIDEFHISEPEGFFSRKRVYVPSKMLVFRRGKTLDAVVVPLPTTQKEAKEPHLAAPVAHAPVPVADPMIPRVTADLKLPKAVGG